jgi:hypothetical protein
MILHAYSIVKNDFGDYSKAALLRCCMVVVSLCCEVVRYSRINRHNPDSMLSAATGSIII